MVKRSANSDGNGDANMEEGQRQNKQRRIDESAQEKSSVDAESNNEIAAEAHETKEKEALCCSGCGIAESAAHGALLLFDDPEEDNKEDDDQQGGVAASKDEKR